MRYQKILIPVDGSIHSKSALKEAVELAKLSNGELLVLHCQRTVPLSLGEPNVQQFIEKLKKKSDEVLNPLDEMLTTAGVSYELRTIGGETATVIADVAKRENFDLIILGSKGKSDLEGLILGSVTHKVLHIAPCPVMVTR
ncbi:MAG: universal stress protein [Desulfovibrio sp.]